MKTTIHPTRKIYGSLSCLVLGVILALSVQTSLGSITLYYDDFQSYPIQNPAPNPLTNGPAGGQWFYVDPVPPLIAGEHQIFEHLGDVTTTGAGFYSRVWASATDNARLSNAISVSALPAGPAPYTFRLSFVVACDTLTATRNITFNYAISSPAGALSFVSGHNLANSQTFLGLSGTGVATAGTTGKSNDRRFEFVFQSSTITTADTITFDITRVTNNAGAVLNILLDDVRLGVDDANGPVVQSVQPVLTLQHVRVNFSEPVDPASATNLANYSFTAGPLSMQGATLLAPSVVELFTSDQAPSSAHTLQISGVLGQSGVSMTSTQLNFTAPAMTISPLRYDAGTTVTQPSGPPSPASAEAGYWLETLSLISGVSVGPVANDNGTGLNAWNITETINGTGAATYSMAIDQDSINLSQTNGWRIVVRDRFVDAFSTTGTDQYIFYYTPGIRYGLSWTLDASTNLLLHQVGGPSYIVASEPDAHSYHTSMMVYNPATKAASFYFDGRLIFDNYTGQLLTGRGVTFGSASASQKASINYNLVQLDVVGATQPVVLQNPASITKNLGEQATFTAAFTPFVNSYQWLSNGVIIAGAAATNYTTGYIDSSYNGVQYRCRALSALGNVETAAASLTVTDNGPQVQSVQSVLTLQHVRVAFSAMVDPATATNLANYSFTAGPLSLQRATIISPSVVEFLTSDQTPGSAHTLQISGVLANGGSTSMTTTQLSFTTPVLTISPLRYDAGTTVTQPSGSLDPTNAAAGYWNKLLPNVAGLSVAPVSDDNGTGFNAWNIKDTATASGTPNYSMLVGQAASMNLAASNGWRIVVRNRLVDNWGSTATDQYILFYIPGVRFGIAWGVNDGGMLYLNAVGPATNYPLTADPFGSYHTNMMVYDPATKRASVYFDGQLIVDNYAGQALVGNGFTFGNANSGAKGEMNYNLVQLDVVEATQPVVLQNPASSVNGVGQKVTFTADFSPFVNAFQWLSNGVVIVGATATNYTTGFIDSSYNGVEYRCRALSALGNVETAAAVLTVTTDVTPPFIVGAKASLLGDRITITYSEPVMEFYATNIANYSWVNAGVTNLSAQMMDPLTVELRAGPFLIGGTYTVLVSNLRDVSNLSITPNSPASVIFPSLSPLARYDAGDTTTAPSGPPDPTSPAGGNWSVTSWSDPDLTVTAVTDDSGTGLNAWQVRDASSLYTYATYTQQLATNVQDNARASGWILTVRARLAEYFGAAVSQFALVTDYNLNRFALSFNLDGNNNLVVGANPGNYTVTSDGSGQSYHLHQMVYNPASATASYYFDGTLIVRGFPATIVANAPVFWGSGSGLGQGTMNYNLVDLSTVYGPLLSIIRNGANIDVSYRGILQSATQFGNPTVWTSVATNSSGGTSVYSIPASSQPQQFFRARSLQ